MEHFCVKIYKHKFICRLIWCFVYRNMLLNDSFEHYLGENTIEVTELGVKLYFTPLLKNEKISPYILNQSEHWSFLLKIYLFVLLE